MSARTYFMKRVKDCKDVSIMSSQEEQSRKFTLFVYYNFLVLLSTPVCSQNINKQNVNIADETLSAFSVGITILNHIEFVTEFPCLLGHPVSEGNCY